MLADLMQLEDKKFLDAVDDILAFEQAKRAVHVWRDGFGIVHWLGPVVGVSLPDSRLAIFKWTPRCHKKRRSTVEHDPALPVTCIACLTSRWEETVV